MKSKLFLAALVGLVVSGCEAGPGAPAVPDKPSPAAGPAHNGAALDATVFKVPLDESPSHGRVDAPVTLVEFSDYQCPFCSRANGTVEAEQKRYGDKLRVVMRENPLPFHPHAREAALVALAAGEQGKYWEMHARLFAEQKDLGEPLYTRLAQELGLDASRFEADRKSPKLAAVIDRDLALGQKLGVRGTPSFFINGRRIVGAQPQPKFEELIDAELAHADQLRAQGVPAEGVYAAAIAHGLEADTAQPAGKNGGQQDEDWQKVEQVNAGGAPSRGPSSAPVTVVAFSDFQCPFCGRSEATLKQLEAAYPGKLRFVMVQKPLPFHVHARDAAKAALAAGEQGKFWEMHDLLFAHNTALDRPALEGYAQQLGLDLAKFRATMDAPETEARVATDEREAERLGVQGTPTFFINGHRVTGAQPLEKFRTVVDASLAQK